MFKLTPTKTKFYDLFDRHTGILVDATKCFVQGLGSTGDYVRLAAEMQDFEHRGDEVTHETLELLHKSFITPLERADIRRLVSTMDDVLDCLEDASKRIALYEIKTVLPPCQQLAVVLVQAAQGVQDAVQQLRILRSKNTILPTCIEIHRLEDEGDRVYHEALSSLFKSGVSALDVIKWKDIIEDLEAAIDRCQDVANVLEGIMLENA